MNEITEFVVNICDVAMNFTTTSNKLILSVIWSKGETTVPLVWIHEVDELCFAVPEELPSEIEDSEPETSDDTLSIGQIWG